MIYTLTLWKLQLLSLYHQWKQTIERVEIYLMVGACLIIHKAYAWTSSGLLYRLLRCTLAYLTIQMFIRYFGNLHNIHRLYKY